MTVQDSAPEVSFRQDGPKDAKPSGEPANETASGSEIPPPKAGMMADVKNLYQSKPDNRGKTSWVEKYPDDLEKATENAESAHFALLVRNKKCYDGRRSLEIDSLIVQSPLLKVALGRVFCDYPGITTSLDRLKFSTPFHPFVHRWSNLENELQNESDPTTKAHLALFRSVLGAELEHTLKTRADFISNGVITYESCWMLFEPGTLVFTIQDGQARAAKLSNGSYANTRCGNSYNLNCQIVDWDGLNFGLGNTSIDVWEWQGTKKITALQAFPFEYHPEMDRTKSQLVRRGKLFEALSGYHYKCYQGIAVGQGPWGSIKYNVDSRIIIDTHAWNRFNPNDQISLNSLGKSSNTQFSDDASDDYDEIDYESGQESAITASNNRGLLTKDQLLLCKPTVKGYSLKNKKWLTFSIGSVKEINFSNAAFESLVLPTDHKELILALAESQVRHKETFDDVVQGKGKGMIMLLSGPPGVGKTLTAEAVAEVMRAPLYTMSAGDLGVESEEIERSLSNVLEMATKWNAILLLDEADVFLEQRSSNDLERNKLVSIFLRMLEYYEGILFLTTNRVDNIDAAFQSRIHLSMQYNDLSKESRKHVWKNFLASAFASATVSNNGRGAGQQNFSEKELDRLAEHKMNGREIKNVLKTAQLLAMKKGVGLGAEHVETILSIEKRRAFGH